MYINDIAEKLISLTRLFADDTSFSYSNRDELQIKTVIDHDLKELSSLLEFPTPQLSHTSQAYSEIGLI
jgi:hypothetical protein